MNPIEIEKKKRFTERAAGLAGLLLIGGVYFAVGEWSLARTARDPALAAEFESEDSRHYLRIAHEFLEGDPFRHYVTKEPHRQPLYPALLAPALALAGSGIRVVGTVGLLTVVATLALLYAMGARILGSPAAGLLVALAYARSDFAFEHATSMAMTEPLYVLCATAALAAALLWVREARPAALWASSVLAGLAYLTRPNGLFFAVGLGVGLWVHERLRRRRAPRMQARQFLLAALLFVATTAPSWLPRLVVWGDPLYHGYLSDYMWVDEYELAHHEGPPRFGPRDYLATHGPLDVASRLAHGAGRVFFRTPWNYDQPLYLIALVGLAYGLRRRSDVRLLATIGVVQVLPIAWTSLSNPTSRVEYGAVLPFELVFALVAGAWLFRATLSRQSEPPGGA